MTRSKASLRQHVLTSLAQIPAEKRTAASAQACALLQRQTIWRQARRILFFAPIEGELDLWPLVEIALSEGKLAALPRFVPQTQSYAACSIGNLNTDIAAGHLRIREPRQHCPRVPLNELDFVLVPGMAFDEYGGRLGRGRGFYDRLLAAVDGMKCGVAFDEQIVPRVPIEPHDVRLDCILTPSRWIEL